MSQLTINQISSTKSISNVIMAHCHKLQQGLTEAFTKTLNMLPVHWPCTRVSLGYTTCFANVDIIITLCEGLHDTMGESLPLTSCDAVKVHQSKQLHKCSERSKWLTEILVAVQNNIMLCRALSSRLTIDCADFRQWLKISTVNGQMAINARSTAKATHKVKSQSCSEMPLTYGLSVEQAVDAL